VRFFRRGKFFSLFVFMPLPSSSLSQSNVLLGSTVVFTGSFGWMRRSFRKSQSSPMFSDSSGLPDLGFGLDSASSVDSLALADEASCGERIELVEDEPPSEVNWLRGLLTSDGDVLLERATREPTLDWSARGKFLFFLRFQADSIPPAPFGLFGFASLVVFLLDFRAGEFCAVMFAVKMLLGDSIESRMTAPVLSQVADEHVIQEAASPLSVLKVRPELSEFERRSKLISSNDDDRRCCDDLDSVSSEMVVTENLGIVVAGLCV